MKVSHKAWRQFVNRVGSDFANKVTSEEAERLAAGPAMAPHGSWVTMDTAQGRRSTGVVCVFRSVRSATSNARYEALRRIVC
eukprot:5183310-Alexandrium_andersonii.AAC.1